MSSSSSSSSFSAFVIKRELGVPTVPITGTGSSRGNPIVVDDAVKPGWAFKHEDPAAPVRDLDEVEGVHKVRLFSADDKAILLYISAVCKTLPVPKHAADVLDTQRFEYYGKQRHLAQQQQKPVMHYSGHFEHEWHGFVDFVNFATLRVLAVIHRDVKALRGVTLLQLLRSSETRSNFASLVNTLIATTTVESAAHYQSDKLRDLASSQKIVADMRFWAGLKGPSAADVVVATGGEDYYFERGYRPPLRPQRTIAAITQDDYAAACTAAGGVTPPASLLPFSETDAFAKPDRRLMFIVRLMIQGMGVYGYERVKLCYDAMKVVPGPVVIPVDAKVEHANDEVSRDNDIQHGFSEALNLVRDTLNQMLEGMGKNKKVDRKGLLQWLQTGGSGLDEAVTFAHLAATCANLQRQASMHAVSRYSVAGSLQVSRKCLTYELVALFLKVEYSAFAHLLG